MKLLTPRCPECNRHASGTVDIIQGIALLGEPNIDDSQDYQGETRVNWDSQKPVKNEESESLVICSNGHTWYTKIDDL